ncbi:hypothetical protein [Actinomadura rupiterrae]|nr:hypothetical protein [Actinomadura rupiterrae]MCP2335713.1 hypothetical protein [Actinomadura rupiterrae]
MAIHQESPGGPVTQPRPDHELGRLDLRGVTDRWKRYMPSLRTLCLVRAR